MRSDHSNPSLTLSAKVAWLFDAAGVFQGATQDGQHV